MSLTLHLVMVDTSVAENETQDTFLQDAETYVTLKVAKYISTFWFPVLIPLGLVGNTLSFLVLIRSNNRKVSTCIYMAAISINDNIMMFPALQDWLVGTVFVREWYLLECVLHKYLHSYCLQCGTYQVLAMTCDKYIAIKWPHRSATYSSPKRAKLIIFTIVICTTIFNFPHFFITAVVAGNCYGFSVQSMFTKIYSWLTIVINAVIPFTLLIHMNYIIVKTVKNSRKSFTDNDRGMDARQKALQSAEKQLTTMLLLVTTLFLILLLPTYIRFIYAAFVTSNTPYKYAISMCIFELSYKLYVTNSSVNFFLYCISGKKFRKDLKEIVCCIKRIGSSSYESCTRANVLSTIS